MSDFALFSIVVLSSLFVIHLVIQARLSRHRRCAGLENRQLKPCPPSPNAVCTEYADDYSHYLPPVKTGFNAAKSIALSVETIRNMGGTVYINDFNYLAATFTSPLLGFVDDFEVRFDAQENTLHLRSASRVGYSDMGANKKRVIRFKQRLASLKNQERPLYTSPAF